MPGNNAAVSEKDYPQLSAGPERSAPASVPTAQNFSALSFDQRLAAIAEKPGTVYNRPEKLLSWERTAQGVRLVCSTAAQETQWVSTHETVLLQYKAAKPAFETLTFFVDCWTPSVFRVRCCTGEFRDLYAGLCEDDKMLVGKPQNVDFSVEETGGELILRTEAIRIVIGREPFVLSACTADSTVPFWQQYRYPRMASDGLNCSVACQNGEYAAFESFVLSYDEKIYGLGERFDSLVRNGRSVDFHNKDAIGTTSPRTYVNIPFYMSTAGYGLFLNSSAPTRWEIGTSDTGSVDFGVLDDQMDYFVLQGDTPKDILSSYCRLTGFSKLPPLWSFGLWMSRNSYTSWDIVYDIAAKLRENDIPCDVLHLDTAWFTEDWNCDLKFSEERFPEPEKNFKKLAEDGFHVSLWQYNYVPPKDNNQNYHEGLEKGYFALDKNGEVCPCSRLERGSWQDDCIIDFTNPEASAWYAEKISALIRMGAGAIKTDFGEGVPDDAQFKNIGGKYFHNLYPLAYNRTVFNATKSVSGENIVWARSGTAGSQRFPLHWGGDSQCTFSALAGTLRAALSIGISGIPFFSHDIGGFMGLPSDELYVRWAQLGLFSSHSRCHGAGNSTHREPWSFSEEACAIFRKYAKLRYSLMPYIYEQAQVSVDTGLPMMRALWLCCPDDLNVRDIDDEYFFGDSLLIAPVLRPLSESTVRSVYLPRGTWYDYHTREKIVSDGQWFRRPVTLEDMPIFVKAGAVLRYCGEQTSLCHGMGPVVRTETWDF